LLPKIVSSGNVIGWTVLVVVALQEMDDAPLMVNGIILNALNSVRFLIICEDKVIFKDIVSKKEGRE